jgi:hypothetical protein
VFFPANGRAPRNISYRINPKEYTSVAAVAVSERICSGAIYSGVPTIAPEMLTTAPLSPPVPSANPKSRITGRSVPLRLFASRMLPGFKSR